MRTHLVAAVTVCGLFLLAGCGEQSPEPKPIQTSSARPSPSSSVSQTPTMPAVAGKRTKAGAIAFVRHFIEVMKGASESGDSEALAALSMRTCNGCHAITELIDEVYEAGGRIEGGGWTITGTKTYAFNGNRFPVDVVVDTAPQTIYSSEGEEPTAYPGGDNRAHYFTLSWQDNRWLVYSLDPR